MSKMKKINREQFKEAVSKNVNIDKKNKVEENKIMNIIDSMSFDTKDNPYIYSAILQEMEGKSIVDVIDGNSISLEIISNAQKKSKKYFAQEINEVKDKTTTENDELMNNYILNSSQKTEEDLKNFFDFYSKLSEEYDKLSVEQKNEIQQFMERHLENEEFNWFKKLYDGEIEEIPDEYKDSKYAKLFGYKEGKGIDKEKFEIFCEIRTKMSIVVLYTNIVKSKDKFIEYARTNGHENIPEDMLDAIYDQLSELTNGNEKTSTLKKEFEETFSEIDDNLTRIMQLNNTEEKGDLKIIKNVEEVNGLISDEGILQEGDLQILSNDYSDSFFEFEIEDDKEMSYDIDSVNNEGETIELFSDESFESAVENAEIMFEEIDSSILDLYSGESTQSVQSENERAHEENNSFSIEDVKKKSSGVTITSLKKAESLIKGIVHMQQSRLDKDNNEITTIE